MRKTFFAAVLISFLGSVLMAASHPIFPVPATGLFSFRPQVLANQNQSASVSSLAAPAPAPNGDTATASLQDFVHTVTNGDPDHVVGVYVPGVLALPVGQQPKGNAGYVTREKDMTTQFNMARKYGTVGILAHNDLAGEQFSGIQMNQYAIVVYGDGRLEYFMIEEIQQYQALSPTSTYSDFINLDGSKERLTATQLFNRIYAPGERLVFQTCVTGEGDPSWGRMFIIARPATSRVLSVVKQASFLLNFASFGLASR